MNDIQIIKKIGEGGSSIVYEVKKLGNKYALKRQKIYRESIHSLNYDYEIWKELDFYKWINELDDINKKFFVKLWSFKFYKCLKSFQKEKKRYLGMYYLLKKSSYCADLLLDLKDNSLRELIDNKELTKKERYSIVIQCLYALQLMHDSDYYHNDIHTRNIAYNITNKEEYIKVNLTNSPINMPIINCQVSLIDYGKLSHINFNPDERIKTKMRENADLDNLVFGLLCNLWKLTEKMGMSMEEMINNIYTNNNKLYQEIKELFTEIYNNVYKNLDILFNEYENGIQNKFMEIIGRQFLKLFQSYFKYTYCNIINTECTSNFIDFDHIRLIIRNKYNIKETIRILAEYCETQI